MGMAGAAKGAAASSPVQVGMPCGWGAPGPSPVMPVPRAHTPSFQLRYRVPQAQLSLAHAGEACGEDMTLAREDGPHGPHSLVGRKPLLGWGETGRGVTQLPAPNYSASWGAPAGPRPGERLCDRREREVRASWRIPRPLSALRGGSREQGKSAGSQPPQRGFSQRGPGLEGRSGLAPWRSARALSAAWPTGSQSASCRSLILLKPVLSSFPSAVKTARSGRAPS